MIESLKDIVKVIEPWISPDLDHPKKWMATCTAIMTFATLIINYTYDDHPLSSFLAAASLVSVIGYAVTKELANQYLPTTPMNKGVALLSCIPTSAVIGCLISNRPDSVNILAFNFLTIFAATLGLMSQMTFSPGSASFHSETSTFQGRTLRDRKVCLILTSSLDENGTFARITPQVISTLKTQKDFHLVTNTITTLNDIEKHVTHLNNNNCTIKVLWLRCHGNEQMLGIHVDANNVVDARANSWTNTQQTFQRIFSKCAPNATIVLESCLTGASNDSIAKKLFNISSGRRIIASNGISSDAYNKLLSTNPFNIRFYHYPDFTRADLTVEFKT